MIRLCYIGRPFQEKSTILYSVFAQMLHYTVFAGNGDEVIASYRELTGPATMHGLCGVWDIQIASGAL